MLSLHVRSGLPLSTALCDRFKKLYLIAGRDFSINAEGYPLFSIIPVQSLTERLKSPK